MYEKRDRVQRICTQKTRKHVTPYSYETNSVDFFFFFFFLSFLKSFDQPTNQSVTHGRETRVTAWSYRTSHTSCRWPPIHLLGGEQSQCGILGWRGCVSVAQCGVSLFSLFVCVCVVCMRCVWCVLWWCGLFGV